jgi:hypothetical protein
MTQATDTEVLQRLDKLTTLVEGVHSELQSIDKKLDVYIATTNEQLKSLDTQVSDIKVQLRSQDNRLWTFVAAAFLTVLGFLAKFALFPASSGQ